MLRILVTNDDGYFSPGVRALADALTNLGEVTVVAPQTEMSAVGHGLTLRRPLRVDKIEAGIYSVDGTPTDCVNIAVSEILGGRPDVVVSGINKGLNVGDDVTYSGTVSGALEGALLGFPAIAVSQQFTAGPWDFTQAAAVAAEWVTLLLEHPLEPRTFLNINVPSGAVRGTRVTVQAKRNHVTQVARRLDPRGQPYYWIEEASEDWEPHDQSDRQAVLDGYVSVTPLQPDLTDHAAIATVEALSRVVGV